jgi:hypothetical protein
MPSPPGVFASQTPQPAYAGAYGAPAQPAATLPRRRTGMILLAQVLMVLKGIFWLLAGIGAVAGGVWLLIHGGNLRDLPGFDAYSAQYGSAILSLAATIVFVVGAVAIVIGVVDLILGVTVGRPSNVSRWFTIVVTVLATVIAVSGLVNELNRAQSMAGILFFAIWIGVNAVVFYALAIDASSRRAFG